MRSAIMIGSGYAQVLLPLRCCDFNQYGIAHVLINRTEIMYRTIWADYLTLGFLTYIDIPRGDLW